jgi:hypothetical protein
MISKNVFRCLIQLFVALMFSPKLSNFLKKCAQGINFQSLLCCFLYTRKLIFSLLFPILCAQGLKFEITSMLFNVILDPITRQKNTPNQFKMGELWNAQFQNSITPPLCQTFYLLKLMLNLKFLNKRFLAKYSFMGSLLNGHQHRIDPTLVF